MHKLNIRLVIATWININKKQWVSVSSAFYVVDLLMMIVCSCFHSYCFPLEDRGDMCWFSGKSVLYCNELSEIWYSCGTSSKITSRHSLGDNYPVTTRNRQYTGGRDRGTVESWAACYVRCCNKRQQALKTWVIVQYLACIMYFTVTSWHVYWIDNKIQNSNDPVYHDFVCFYLLLENACRRN